MVGYLFIAVAAIALAGFLMGRSRAQATSRRQALRPAFPAQLPWRLHSGLDRHSLMSSSCLFWLLFQGTVIDNLLVRLAAADKVSGLDKAELDLLISQIKSAAGGTVFGEPEPFVSRRRRALQQLVLHIPLGHGRRGVLALCIGALLYTRAQIAGRFRARHRVERVLDGVMIFCSIAAILTTFGIVISLLVETLRFFDRGLAAGVLLRV